MLSNTIPKYFIGEWAINRSIENTGLYKGHAIFLGISKDKMTYREDGETHFDDGTKIAGFKNFIYQINDSNLDIFFDDGIDKGQKYLSILLRDLDENSCASDIYLCGEDTYNCTYQIHDDNNFQITTKISGPKKDYLLKANYTRVVT